MEAADGRPVVVQPMNLRPPGPQRLDDVAKAQPDVEVVAARTAVEAMLVLHSCQSHRSPTVVSSPAASPEFWFHHLSLVGAGRTGAADPGVVARVPVAGCTAVGCVVPRRLPGSRMVLRGETGAER